MHLMQELRPLSLCFNPFSLISGTQPLHIMLLVPGLFTQCVWDVLQY